MPDVTFKKLATLSIHITPDAGDGFYDQNDIMLESYKKRVEDGNTVFPVSLSGRLIIEKIYTDENGFPHIDCDFRGSLIEEDR